MQIPVNIFVSFCANDIKIKKTKKSVDKKRVKCYHIQAPAKKSREAADFEN